MESRKDSWSTDDEMFAIVHRMRTRIITSPSFTGERILAAILFENTMDRDIEGQPTADYLWNIKRVVPFLKVDKGLAAANDGVQLMKPMPGLAALLSKAKTKNIFGTKMRSVIKQANEAGIKSIVSQQFDVAAQIIAADLVPIIEPEVDIHCPEKAKAEQLLKAAILEKLNTLPADQLVMLKLTLPEKTDFYNDCVHHPNIIRVVALSGGYTRDQANDRLRRNHGIVASFSRALLEGLLPSSPMLSLTPSSAHPFRVSLRRPHSRRRRTEIQRRIGRRGSEYADRLASVRSEVPRACAPHATRVPAAPSERSRWPVTRDIAQSNYENIVSRVRPTS